MVAIAATSYATPSVQAWQGRARVEQARREADQAEARARQLRTQARQAEDDAARDQDRLQAVRAEVARSDSTYSAQLRQQISAGQSRRTQNLLTATAAVAGNQYRFAGNPLAGGANAWTQAGAAVASIYSEFA